MREMYERAYGIHDHSDGRLSPLHLVCLHQKENVSEFSDLYNKHRRFITLDMAKYTGLSVVEFFNQPRELTELWFRTVSDDNVRRMRTDKDPLEGLQ